MSYSQAWFHSVPWEHAAVTAKVPARGAGTASAAFSFTIFGWTSSSIAMLWISVTISPGKVDRGSLQQPFLGSSNTDSTAEGSEAS